MMSLNWLTWAFNWVRTDDCGKYVVQSNYFPLLCQHFYLLTVNICQKFTTLKCKVCSVRRLDQLYPHMFCRVK